MTALTRFLFRSALEPQSTSSTIRWWESRRPAFNVAVGVAGVATLTTAALVSALWPRGVTMLGVPWGLVLAYGILANIFYTCGWGAELALRRLLGDNAAPAGATLFRYGLVFSIGLTLFPGLLVVLDTMVRIVWSILFR